MSVLNECIQIFRYYLDNIKDSWCSAAQFKIVFFFIVYVYIIKNYARTYEFVQNESLKI